LSPPTPWVGGKLFNPLSASPRPGKGARRIPPPASRGAGEHSRPLPPEPLERVRATAAGQGSRRARQADEAGHAGGRFRRYLERIGPVFDREGSGLFDHDLMGRDRRGSTRSNTTDSG